MNKIQVTPYYRFLFFVMVAASSFLFLLMGRQLWYVLSPGSGIAILSAGLAFFVAALWHQRETTSWHPTRGIWCWLAWLVWSVIAGLSCTIYSAHFMDRSAFTGNPDALIAAIPYITGFMPVFVLTTFLFVAGILWPLSPQRTQTAS